MGGRALGAQEMFLGVVGREGIKIRSKSKSKIESPYSLLNSQILSSLPSQGIHAN